jgi:hypothetical protein
MAPAVGAALWDDEGYSLIERPVQLARDTGALDRLPILLNQMPPPRRGGATSRPPRR